MPRRLILMSAGALTGVFLALAIALAMPTQPTSADQSLDTEEAAFVVLINNYRAQNGLGALTIDWDLQPPSDWMSADLGINSYFEHNDHCTGDCINGHAFDSTKTRDPWNRMCQIGGYCYNTWKGENIAAGFTTAQSVFTAWQNSPGHNANMLGPNYNSMGLARVYVANSPFGWYWTNDFGGVRSGALPPAGGTITPTPTPTPTPTATPSPTKSPSPSPTKSPTPSPVPATSTPSPTKSPSPTPVPATSTASPTHTPSPTPTLPQIPTPAPTSNQPTATPRPTSGPTSPATPTHTPSPTLSHTPSPTPTPSHSATPRPTSFHPTPTPTKAPGGLLQGVTRRPTRTPVKDTH